MSHDNKYSIREIYGQAEWLTRYVVLGTAHFVVAFFSALVVGGFLEHILVAGFHVTWSRNWLAVVAGTPSGLAAGFVVVALLPKGSREGRFAFLLPTLHLGWYTFLALLGGREEFKEFSHTLGMVMMLLLVAASASYSLAQFVGYYLLASSHRQ